ncbi:hypothetical protein AKO1_013260 [Acrasis kona]|uniref:Uncharacterized protein n=1 Tax=Acrasis kona TaxID=1008807 RepID=A0AAW2YYG7_9EUKA
MKPYFVVLLLVLVFVCGSFQTAPHPSDKLASDVEQAESSLQALLNKCSAKKSHSIKHKQSKHRKNHRKHHKKQAKKYNKKHSKHGKHEKKHSKKHQKHGRRHHKKHHKKHNKKHDKNRDDKGWTKEYLVVCEHPGVPPKTLEKLLKIQMGKVC